MLSRTVEFTAKITQRFHLIKSIESKNKIQKYIIPIPGSPAYLEPICKFHSNDGVAVKLLTDWRRDNSFAFPSEFNITEEGTLHWMDNILFENQGRILFFVVNSKNQPVGHLGFSNCLNDDKSMEIDNVVRGIKNTDAGIMTVSMVELIKWAKLQFNPARIYLRVFSTNQHAIIFYQKLGFYNDGLIPL